MKVVIITDTPTMLLRSPRGQYELAGSYRSVTTARLTLEEKGHEVNTLVVLNDLTASSEHDLLKMLISDPSLVLANVKGGLNLSDTLKHSAFDALLVSLATDKLRSVLPFLFRFLKNMNFEPIVFIGAGKKTREHVLQLSDMFEIPVNVFDKPGVARVTSKGLDMFMAALGR